jgi:hypothetical protein
MNVSETVKRVVTDFVCGYCLAQSGYDVVTADCIWRHDDLWAGGTIAEGKAFVIVECRSCRLPTLFVFDVYYDEYIFWTDEGFSPEFYCLEHPGVISVDWDASERLFEGCTGILFIGQYPYGHKFSESVPEAVCRDLEEAGNCLAVNATNACAAMCRRAIEQLANSLGIEPESNLCNTLKKMRDSGYIDQGLFEALYEVKQWGNIGAHADPGLIGLKEARNLLELVIRAVEYVYLKREIVTTADRLRQRRKVASVDQ